MDRINSLIVKLQNGRQEGQAMVEYALVIGVVSLAAVVGAAALGTGIDGAFTDLAGYIGGLGFDGA